jgi:PmbA protein
MSVEQLLEISEKTLKLALKEKVDQAQVTAFLFDSARTRFANSQIHQNVATKNNGVTVKVVLGKKIGFMRADVLEAREIENAVKQAVKIAKVNPENKDFKSLPQPEKWQPLADAFDEETANCSPEYRAEKVKEAIETAHSKSPIVKAVAGSFLSGSYSFAVTNSLGVSAWAKMSMASMNITVISEKAGSEGFGYAEENSRHIKDINPVRLAEQASEKSVNSVNPIKMSPGEYEVILSPLAVSTLFFYLSYIGFSASAYQQGESFVKYNLNKQVFDEKLSAKDDASDPRTMFKLPIDGEGVPKKMVPFIDKGVVSEKSIFYDTLTADRENRKSTGHALPQGLMKMVQMIPFPLNVLVYPGDATLEEMIEETKRGIFVTRFHYTNPVNPPKAILTGLTRDGTFLIENGKLTKPIKNMRYTDSMLSALRQISMIGKELESVEEGLVTAPAMKLPKLRFTGVTEY